VIYQPSSGEDAIEMVDSMVSSGAFELVIVDSVAALTPEAEINGEIGDQNMALHARLMSKFMRRIVTPLQQSGTALILINQLRTMLGSYGAPERPTGGKAIPFYASVRIEIRSNASQRLGDAKTPYGQTCTATVKKNKVGPPHRTCEYDLIFNEGISAEGSILEVAEATGVISRPKGSGTYTETASGEVLGTSKDKTKAHLAEHPEVLERLTAAVMTTLHGEVLAEPAANEGDPELAEVGAE
jgi:recombination protein RecA